MKTIEITREQFYDDLCLFATQWVSERQVKLAAQAEEIWENKQVLLMLNKWAEAKRALEAHRIADFALIMAGEDPFYAEGDKWKSERCGAYLDILTDILFDYDQLPPKA